MNTPLAILMLGSLLLARLAVLPAAAAPAQPNILWIMSDDHAAHAIGAYTAAGWPA